MGQLLGEAPFETVQIPHVGLLPHTGCERRIRAHRARALPSGERNGSSSRCTATCPAGMVWVPARTATAPAPEQDLPGYWMDTYEVSNRQFKAFVDAGGYTKKSTGPIPS